MMARSGADPMLNLTSSWRSARRVLLASVAVVAGLLLGIVALRAAYMRLATTVVGDVVSPDGTWAAVLMVRNLGAMGDFSTQLSIVPARDLLARQLAVYRRANVFVVDTDHGAAPSGDQGQVALQIAWLTSTVLAVRYPEKTRIFKQASRVGPVDVDYAVSRWQWALPRLTWPPMLFQATGRCGARA